MNYYTYMNRNQIKSALINCAKTHGISLSELASEAGISPSTITGFVNDAKTRADHVLSMRTIGKLTKKFPDLANFLQIAEPYDDKKLKEVRVIGLVDFENNQNFIVRMSASLTLNNSATGNLNIGQTGVIVFIQDGSGSRTLTLSSDFESPAAGGITLSTTANATDIVPYIILGPDRILLGTPQLAFG